jgi:hypothetical protein
MEIFQSQDYTCSHKFRRSLIEASAFLQDSPHVPAQTRFHQIVEILSVLERLVEPEPAAEQIMIYEREDEKSDK